jgi:hypothetical protein
MITRRLSAGVFVYRVAPAASVDRATLRLPACFGFGVLRASFFVREYGVRGTEY